MEDGTQKIVATAYKSGVTMQFSANANVGDIAIEALNLHKIPGISKASIRNIADAITERAKTIKVGLICEHKPCKDAPESKRCMYCQSVYVTPSDETSLTIVVYANVDPFGNFRFAISFSFRPVVGPHTIIRRNDLDDNDVVSNITVEVVLRGSLTIEGGIGARTESLAAIAAGIFTNGPSSGAMGTKAGRVTDTTYRDLNLSVVGTPAPRRSGRRGWDAGLTIEFQKSYTYLVEEAQCPGAKADAKAKQVA